MEWVPGATPTSYFYDANDNVVSEHVLGDRSLTELLSFFDEVGFKPKVEQIPYPDAPTATKEYGGHTYEIFALENFYPTALQFAQSRGNGEGYVVTISSAGENVFLSGVLKELGIRKAWLGGTDEGEEGQWKWMGGPEKDVVFWSTNPDKPATGYANWFKGEPNDSDNEDCSIFFEDGWNDASCVIEKAALIVEIGKEPLQEPPAPEVTPAEVPQEEKKSDL